MKNLGLLPHCSAKQIVFLIQLTQIEMRKFHYLLIIIVLASCNTTENPQDPTQPSEPQRIDPPLITFSVVKTYPHDSSFFTEGLEFHKGKLLESSGGNDQDSPYPSAMGIANLTSGKVERKVELDRSKYFGEGITVFNGKLFMLTWKGGTGFIFDVNNFKKTGEFKIPSPEGWGLTHDTSSLIMSDGSNSLYALDPNTLQVKNIIGVLDNGGPVSNINELEYVNGHVYANQWLTPYIYKIEWPSGKVVGRIDFSRFSQEMEDKYPESREMNGIAYDTAKGTFYITGKKWPLIYEIKLQ